MKTITEMAREAECLETFGMDAFQFTVEELERFAELARADERERFYGQDKPAECASGCPANQICDYCQIVEPVKKMIAAAVAREREACAKVCENIYEGDEACGDWPSPEQCADAIRARGNT